MYNSVKEVAKQPTLLAPILGFINPATAVPILAAGIIVYAVIKIFENDKKEPLNKPLPNGSATVKSTVPAIANEPLNNAEMIKKEMIRQAMSELGKRSGKARARKREMNIEAEI